MWLFLNVLYVTIVVDYKILRDYFFTLILFRLCLRSVTALWI